jgi:hypothetical protein
VGRIGKVEVTRGIVQILFTFLTHSLLYYTHSHSTVMINDIVGYAVQASVYSTSPIVCYAVVTGLQYQMVVVCIRNSIHIIFWAIH